MFEPTPAAFAAGLANRALAGETWAREKLAAHAGKIFLLEVGPVTAPIAIDGDGALAAAPAGSSPALTLSLSPLAVPALLADPSRWHALVRCVGDPALASSLEELSLTLPWFIERAFGIALGPVVGQKVADAGRALLVIPGEVARRASGSFGQFAAETDLVATRSDMRKFGDDTAALDLRVSELSARVDALAAGLDKPKRPKAR